MITWTITAVLVLLLLSVAVAVVIGAGAAIAGYVYDWVEEKLNDIGERIEDWREKRGRRD
jgi:hypothetical protein